MNLEGVRLAKSSFARVIFESGHLDAATCSKARCGVFRAPSRRSSCLLFRLRGFFERLATSVQPEAAKKGASAGQGRPFGERTRAIKAWYLRGSMYMFMFA